MSNADPNETGSGMPANTPQNLPIVSDAQLQVVTDVMGPLGRKVLHSFTGTPREVWGKTAKATGPDTMSVADLKGAPFAIQDYYVHAVAMDGATPGEIEDRIRVVLIDPNGKQLAMVSDGAAKDVAGLIQTVGLGPYVPPIDVNIVPIKTRKGFTVFRIVPVS